MNLQLIGTPKCQDTKKAQRWLKERRFDFHFLDLTVKPLAPGELDSVARATGGHEALLDTKSKAYEKRGLAYLDANVRDELLSLPDLLKTPILRDGKRALVGFDEKRWAHFVSEGGA